LANKERGVWGPSNVPRGFLWLPVIREKERGLFLPVCPLEEGPFPLPIEEGLRGPFFLIATGSLCLLLGGAPF